MSKYAVHRADILNLEYENIDGPAKALHPFEQLDAGSVCNGTQLPPCRKPVLIHKDALNTEQKCQLVKPWEFTQSTPLLGVDSKGKVEMKLIPGLSIWIVDNQKVSALYNLKRSREEFNTLLWIIVTDGSTPICSRLVVDGNTDAKQTLFAETDWAGDIALCKCKHVFHVKSPDEGWAARVFKQYKAAVDAKSKDDNKSLADAVRAACANHDIVNKLITILDADKGGKEKWIAHFMNKGDNAESWKSSALDNKDWYEARFGAKGIDDHAMIDIGTGAYAKVLLDNVAWPSLDGVTQPTRGTQNLTQSVLFSIATNMFEFAAKTKDKRYLIANQFTGKDANAMLLRAFTTLTSIATSYNKLKESNATNAISKQTFCDGIVFAGARDGGLVSTNTFSLAIYNFAGYKLAAIVPTNPDGNTVDDKLTALLTATPDSLNRPWNPLSFMYQDLAFPFSMRGTDGAAMIVVDSQQLLAPSPISVMGFPLGKNGDYKMDKHSIPSAFADDSMRKRLLNLLKAKYADAHDKALKSAAIFLEMHYEEINQTLFAGELKIEGPFEKELDKFVVNVLTVQRGDMLFIPICFDVTSAAFHRRCLAIAQVADDDEKNIAKSYQQRSIAVRWNAPNTTNSADKSYCIRSGRPAALGKHKHGLRLRQARNVALFLPAPVAVPGATGTFGAVTRPTTRGIDTIIQEYDDTGKYNNLLGTIMADIENKKKTKHWIWYVMPQIYAGGSSELKQDETPLPLFNKHTIKYGFIMQTLLKMQSYDSQQALIDAWKLFFIPDDENRLTQFVKAAEDGAKSNLRMLKEIKSLTFKTFGIRDVPEGHLFFERDALENVWPREGVTRYQCIV